MKISKSLLSLLLLSLMSCNAQNEATNKKIIALNDFIQIFHWVNEIDIDHLEERKRHTGDKNYDKLKMSISKDRLNKKVIELFNNNFTSEEIDTLYSQAISSLEPEANQYQAVVSARLKKKRKRVYPKFFEEGYKALDNFKQQLYILDSINYNPQYTDTTVALQKTLNTINGLYETVSFDESKRNTKDFLNSITIRKHPVLTFDKPKIKILPQQGTGLFYSIQITLNKGDTEKLYLSSLRNTDKPLAIVVDKKIIMAPFVRGPIEDGVLFIIGNISYDKAKTIANNIQNAPMHK